MTDKTEQEPGPERSPEEMRDIIQTAPMPCEGEKPWNRQSGEDAYSLVSNCLARALLIVCEEKPELLDVSQEMDEDPSGMMAADNQKLWVAAKERFPGLSVWLGGPTGFQFGWAHNVVRYVLGAEEVGNPAVVEIRPR